MAVLHLLLLLVVSVDLNLSIWIPRLDQLPFMNVFQNLWQHFVTLEQLLHFRWSISQLLSSGDFTSFAKLVQVVQFGTEVLQDLIFEHRETRIHDLICNRLDLCGALRVLRQLC